jgi:hypothetical protein
MPSMVKGILVGIANVVLIALIGAVLETQSITRLAEAGLALIVIFMLPGTLFGLVLGCIAGHITRARRIILIGAGTLAAAILCGFGLQALTIVAVLATAAAMVFLEWWTRGPREPMLPVWRGAVLGLVNLLAIAVLVGVRVKTHGRGGGDPEELGWTNIHNAREGIQMIAMFGLVPAFGAGAAIGAMAGAFAALHRWLRFALLAPPALVFTAMFGALFDERGVILAAWIPTLVCVAMLEKWTRRPEPIPVAVAVHPKGTGSLA